VRAGSAIGAGHGDPDGSVALTHRRPPRGTQGDGRWRRHQAQGPRREKADGEDTIGKLTIPLAAVGLVKAVPES